jgi:hypothetical protein
MTCRNTLLTMFEFILKKTKKFQIQISVENFDWLMLR